MKKHLFADEEKNMLTSPDFNGKNYKENQFKCWIINNKPKRTLELEFSLIHMENTLNCSNDYIAVYDYEEKIEIFSLRGKFCGHSKSFHIKTTHNFLIEFKTNEKNSNYPGFKMYYMIIPSIRHENLTVSIAGTICLSIVIIIIAINITVCCVCMCQRCSKRPLNNTSNQQVLWTINSNNSACSIRQLQPNGTEFTDNQNAIFTFHNNEIIDSKSTVSFPPSYDNI